jgi:hypothetical protein
MADAWIETDKLKARLVDFFAEQRTEFIAFGNTVNQTFEAFVFAQVVAWYKARGWNIRIVNAIDKKSKKPEFKLKFNTRGHPAGYSYAVCTSVDGAETVQVRHQLRVATRHYRDNGISPPANICLDVAVVRDISLDELNTDDHVSNTDLVTFGEAKHMSAFAELVASFVGMVHELQPERLKQRQKRKASRAAHPSPFLFVSGRFWVTAEGIIATIDRRGLDIKMFNRIKSLAEAIALPTDNAPRRVNVHRARGKEQVVAPPN